MSNRPASRAMINRCISDVPSVILKRRPSRQYLCMGYSIMYPYPPWICIESARIFCRVSAQKSFTMEDSFRTFLP